MNTGRNDNELERKNLDVNEWMSEWGIVTWNLSVYAWNTDGINGFPLCVFLGTSMLAYKYSSGRNSDKPSIVIYSVKTLPNRSTASVCSFKNTVCMFSKQISKSYQKKGNCSVIHLHAYSHVLNSVMFSFSLRFYLLSLSLYNSLFNSHCLHSPFFV